MTLNQLLNTLRDPSKTCVHWNPSAADLAGFKVADVALIAEALKANTHVTDFQISDLAIGDEGAIAIANALKCNTTLRHLSLCNCEIGEQGAIELAQVIAQHPSLNSLELDGNLFGSAGIAALINAVEGSSKITQLRLAKCEINNQDAVHLANLLRRNGVLVLLNLNFNKLTSVGVGLLAQALEENRTLQILELSNGKFNDKGAISLANMLRVNKGLLSLNLCTNSISVDGEKQLADALLVNMTLCELGLSTPPDDEGTPAHEILHRTVRNNALHAVNLIEKYFEGGISRQSALLEERSPTEAPTDFDVAALESIVSSVCHGSVLELDTMDEVRNAWLTLMVHFHLQCIDHECDTQSPAELDPFVTTAIKTLAQIDPNSVSYAKACGYVADYFYLRAIGSSDGEDSRAFFQSAMNFYEKTNGGHETKIFGTKQQLEKKPKRSNPPHRAHRPHSRVLCSTCQQGLRLTPSN